MKNSVIVLLITFLTSLISCTQVAKKHEKVVSKPENSNTRSNLPLASELDFHTDFKPPSDNKEIIARIDSQSEILVEKNISTEHYSIKKMDAIFKIIHKMFTDQYLTDYWLKEYLKAQIEENGLINSEKYINEFLQSCKTKEFKNDIDKYVDTIMESRIDHDISIYKTENDFQLEAHIFRPKGISKTEKRPAIVIFHGGGWSMGSPIWAFKDARHYSELGIIGIAGHYRLSNRRDITPVEAMQDAKDLIIWLRMNADSLGIDKDRIAAAGWSAGAHLAASTAIFADTLTKEKINSMPNALLLNSPAVDLANENWFNKMLNNRPVNPTSLSPLESVFKGLPPTILLQGRDDTVTPLKGTQSFHDKMIEYGNYCELWVYDNVGHLFTPSNLNDRGQPRPDKEIRKKAEKKADEFLMKIGYLKE